jgi:IclR family KDG regulon transcriptional repressor
MAVEDSGDKQLSAVSRTITVLEVLSRYKAINLEQLAKEADLPKATLLRFLGTLIQLGYVYRDPYDRYALTLKMFSVGSRSIENIDLVRDATPVAEELVKALGETVHMGILENEAAIYVLKVSSKYNMSLHSRVGKSIPLYCTGIGKMLLSGLPADELDAILSRIKLVPFTPHTLKTRAALEKELADIRKNGWAMDREEHEEGVSCISAPVRDHSGAIIAALSVSWPMFRYEREKESEYIETITSAAGRISAILGYVRR